MTEPLVLRNAPLVEVIAEVHWKFPVGELNAGGHDPQWFAFADRMARCARDSGYASIERLVPAGTTVPLDLLGRAPILRFRPEAGKWPLMQLGQGLLTINAVPPYDGWSKAIAPRLAQALEALENSRFEAAKDQPIEKLELHYMDAFTEKHGVPDARTYLDAELGLFPDCPAPWRALCVLEEAPSFTGEYRFKLAAPEGSVAVVKYGSGSINPSMSGVVPAAIFDFIVSVTPGRVMSIAEVLDWFEGAHTASRSLLDGSLSATVRKVVT